MIFYFRKFSLLHFPHWIYIAAKRNVIYRIMLLQNLPLFVVALWVHSMLSCFHCWLSFIIESIETKKIFMTSTIEKWAFSHFFLSSLFCIQLAFEWNINDKWKRRRAKCVAATASTVNQSRSYLLAEHGPNPLSWNDIAKPFLFCCSFSWCRAKSKC